jgi:zinc-ribbon domain/Putative prokaryotic signal transducing protein
MDSDRDPAHLLCPSCGREHPPSERFCGSCGMPLVHAADASEAEELTGERREQARKIKPQYSEGRLVKVAYAQNQPEAELIQGLLLEEGIPSMTRRAPGFDVPDFLAAGPRHILVPESGAEAAREALQAPPSDEGHSPN